MSIPLMGGNSFYYYNAETNKVGHKHFKDDLLNLAKDLVNDAEKPTKTIADVLGPAVKVTISEESQKMMDELRSQKQQREVDRLADIYEKSGFTAEPPKAFSDISTTDRALLQMSYMADNEGATGGLMTPLTLMSIDGQLFSNTTSGGIASTAMQGKYLDQYYSDDEILNRINHMKLDDSVDRDMLFQAAKSRGETELGTIEKRLAEMKESLATSEGNRIHGQMDNAFGVRTDGDGFSESMRSLIDSAFSHAKRMLNEGFSGNLSEHVKDYMLTSDVEFNYDGVSATFGELVNTHDLLKDAKIDFGPEAAKDVRDYTELGKYFGGLYKEYTERAESLPEEMKEKALSRIKDGLIEQRLTINLFADSLSRDKLSGFLQVDQEKSDSLRNEFFAAFNAALSK